MSDEKILLELKNVSKEYDSASGTASVLEDIEFRVESGESISVVGPSGCGKSTLLNLLAALDSPTTGTVAFDGKDLSKMTESEAAKFRNEEVGLVFQLHHLLPQCNVLENVLVPSIINKKVEKSRERALRLLERVGLSERLTYRPGQLSGGERQRVAIVRALINEPRLLLADEPTGSLNRENAENLAQLMLELNKEEGMTLIVVTHSMHLAEMMGRVLELRDGKLVEQV